MDRKVKLLATRIAYDGAIMEALDEDVSDDSVIGLAMELAAQWICGLHWPSWDVAEAQGINFKYATWPGKPETYLEERVKAIRLMGDAPEGSRPGLYADPDWDYAESVEKWAKDNSEMIYEWVARD